MMCTGTCSLKDAHCYCELLFSNLHQEWSFPGKSVISKPCPIGPPSDYNSMRYVLHLVICPFKVVYGGDKRKSELHIMRGNLLKRVQWKKIYEIMKYCCCATKNEFNNTA